MTTRLVFGSRNDLVGVDKAAKQWATLLSLVNLSTYQVPWSLHAQKRKLLKK